MCPEVVCDKTPLESYIVVLLYRICKFENLYKRLKIKGLIILRMNRMIFNAQRANSLQKTAWLQVRWDVSNELFFKICVR